MRVRGTAGCVIVFLTALAVPAQESPHPPASLPPSPAWRPPGPAPDCLDLPTQYPPLLRPPVNPSPPLAEVPRGPVGEYDHGQLYLPDYVPPSAPEACRPLGRWWISPSFEFAWVPKRPAPVDVRLRLPVPGGGSIPGPVLPVAGRSTDSFQAGFGLTGGWWFNPRNTRGIEASFFTLGGGDRTFDALAPGMLVFFPDGSSSAPQFVIFPLDVPITGILPVTLSTWYVAADLNYRHNLYCSPNARLDLLAGYRFAALEEELFLGEVPDGSRDDYRHNRAMVSNPFHGGQVGLAGEYRGDRWYVSGAAKLALGAVRPDVCACGLFRGTEGFTGPARFTPAGPRRGLGGDGYSTLAALSDNGDSRFAVLPSINVQLGRQVGEHARLYVGYSFQYLSEVVRLGDVLDPAAARPGTTDFWVQSLGLGFELRY